MNNMDFLKNTVLSLSLTTLIVLTAGSGSSTIASAHHHPTTQHGRVTKFSLYKRVFVDIWNRMPQGMELTAHCKSKDDNLGIMGAGTDIAISFDFKPNWIGTTLYHCVLQSSYGEVSFDVYDFGRDYAERCLRQCVWNVREDGVHGVNQSNQREDVNYNWGPIQY